MSDTYETAHVGDVVRGHDGNDWRVTAKGTDPQRGPYVALVNRAGVQVVGYPPAGTPITFVERADHAAEQAAAGALIAAFGSVELIAEWES